MSHRFTYLTDPHQFEIFSFLGLQFANQHCSAYFATLQTDFICIISLSFVFPNKTNIDRAGTLVKVYKR